VPQVKAKLVLRRSFFDEVSSYGGGAKRRTPQGWPCKVGVAGARCATVADLSQSSVASRVSCKGQKWSEPAQTGAVQHLQAWHMVVVVQNIIEQRRSEWGWCSGVASEGGEPGLRRVSLKSELRGLLFIGGFDPWRAQQGYEVDSILNWSSNFPWVAIQRKFHEEHVMGKILSVAWVFRLHDENGLGLLLGRLGFTREKEHARGNRPRGK
jgi:hypothetical protein